MPQHTEPELKLSTSLKNLGGFIRTGIAALGALGLGAAGSILTSSANTDALEAKVKVLEEASQSYAVRISTSEAKVYGLENSYADIKKDLAEIRSTNTQILFELQKDKRK